MENRAEIEAIANQVVRGRASTLKRLWDIPAGKEHWRPVAGAMSAADTASHLLACDAAYLDAMNSGRLGSNLGRATTTLSMKRADYENLLNRLEESVQGFSADLKSLNDAVLNRSIEAVRKEGVQTLLMREVLMTLIDHEAHHRGQIVVYLKLCSP